MLFKDTLATLPPIDHLAGLKLWQGDQLIAHIHNQPGQAGSVRVYHALYQRFGLIDTAAAEQGLLWYAEHTADARARPGAHPNIDRLLNLVAGAGLALRVELSPANT